MRMSTAQALQLADEHLRNGSLAEVETICSAVLGVEPDSAQAYALWGGACFARGQIEQALRLFEAALGRDPTQGNCHNNLAVVLNALGRFAEAESAARQAQRCGARLAEVGGNLARALRAQGRLVEAETVLVETLRDGGDYPFVFNELGQVRAALGRREEALAAHREALARNPQNVDALLPICCLEYAAGRPAAAEAAARQLVALDPLQVDGWSILGGALLQQRQTQAALEVFLRTAEMAPQAVEVHSNIAAAYLQMERYVEAEQAARRALQFNPQAIEPLLNLGSALRGQRRFADTEVLYRELVQRDPHNARAYNNLGNTYLDQARMEEALQHFKRALEIDPQQPEAAANLGYVLLGLNRYEEAELFVRHALGLRPDFVNAQHTLGFLLQLQGRLAEAEAACRRAVALDPQFGEAYANLASALQAQGRLAEALEFYRKALEVNPRSNAAHSNILSCLQYEAGATPADLAAEHRQWDQRHAQPLHATWRPHANLRDPQRRLRLGFVSADFCHHPVGFFFLRALQSLDRRQVEAVVYSDRAWGDGITAQLRAAADRWSDVKGLSDADLADAIRRDGIDVLFDMTGHWAGNRMLLFARKPAPVQVSWMAYEGTTGLEAMDYVLADAHLVQPEDEAFYTERVLRMPETYVCYAPPENAPEPGPLAAAEQGPVTFGSFNNLCKITPPTVACWSRLLNRVAGSRLKLKYRGLDDPAVAARFRALFAAQGITADRLDLEGWSEYVDFLTRYHAVDVALDPFPFGGGLTTCEALWMGVPVVTLRGKTFAGRHSVSYLSTLGLSELIAADVDSYIELAAGLAADRPRLAALRSGLRQRMADSPLCDGPRFAQFFLERVREAWQIWCARQG